MNSLFVSIQVAEQPSSEVLRHHVELLGVRVQVSVELLRVLRLQVVLLLLVHDVFEVRHARPAEPTPVV